MVEFMNVIIAFIAGLIGGLALHSAWRHTYGRKKER